VDTNPFAQARAYLNYTPLARWGSVVSSILASVCLVLLFPVLFLFVDLLTWHGRVPAYTSLPQNRQKAFREEWDAGFADKTKADEVVHKLRPAGLTADLGTLEWEWRWQATNYAALESKVNHEAAEAYLPLDTPGKGYPSPNGLGVLGTVARERTRWTGSVLGWFAGWNPWAWRPGDNGSANIPYLTGLFLIALFLMVVRGVLLNLASYWAAVATVEAATRLRRTIYKHGYRLGALAVKPDAQDEAADLITRRVEQVQDGLHAHLIGVPRAAVLTGLLTVLLLLGHFWLTVALLVLAVVVWLLAGQAAAWYRRDARLADRRAAARLGMMRESFSVMPLVKAYLMERYAQNRFERHLSDLSRSVWRRNRGETFSRPTLLAIVSLAAVAMLYLAGRVVLAGEMSVAGLVVKAAGLGVLVWGLNRWIAARVRIGRARAAAADVFEFLDRRGDGGQAMDAEFLQPMAKKLEFVGVSLREAGTGRMVLEDVSFALPAGSRAALVFTDPDEAHAVAHLLTRFAEPTGGEIRIDGKNTRWVTSESIRTQVALVMESGTTFTDTVANNIGCGEPGFTLPQIIEAAKVAHAHQFVQRLPYGYETLIGDGGSVLKPGERFRIALARAVLRDPSLVVIEEPAEPLDADSLVLIDDAITRIQPGRTLLFLARRPSTVKSADRVFVLTNGKLAAAGSHEELINGSELYRLLHFKQTLTATA
jgi:ABC-type multidrug transport system fused ATPase/permease subunit